MGLVGIILKACFQDAEDARDEVDAVKRSMHNIELWLQQSELDHSHAVLAIQVGGVILGLPMHVTGDIAIS